MSAPSPGSRPLPQWFRSSWIWIALLVLVAVTIAPSLRQPHLADWLNTYVMAARQMVAHQPINDGGPLPPGVGRYTYMPAAAVYALPVAFTSPMVSLVAWYVASLAAISAGFVCAWRLVGGPAFAAVSRHWLAIFGVATFLVLRFVISAFGNRQTDLLITGAALAGCWFVATRRQWRGAVFLGLAASIKGPPLLFAPYLAWRGWWRAAALLVVVVLSVNLLPDLFWPRGKGESHLADWRHALAPVRDAPPGVWFADVFRNQSVAGVVGRYMAFGFITATPQIRDELPPMSSTRVLTAKVLVYAIDLLLLGATMFAFRKKRNGSSETPPVAEMSAVVCLMLLLSPMTAKAHMCTLLLPVLLIAREIVQHRTRGWIALGVLLALTGPLAAGDLLGKELGHLTLAWGVPALFTLLCLVGTWGVRR